VIHSTRRAPSRRTVLLAGALLAAGCSTARQDPGGEAAECVQCHGDASRVEASDLLKAAPPFGSHGEASASDLAVGAHQAHLGRANFRPAVQCEECHPVPASGAAHVDGVVAFAWSGGATLGGAAPAWSVAGGTGTCSGVYCHGATLPAGDRGTASTPAWNAPGQPHLDCGSCHGYPPGGHSAGSTDCHACHAQTVNADNLSIDLAGGHHLDGIKDFPTSCTACHGDAARPEASDLLKAAPPVGTHGETSTSDLAVGAHQAHLHDSGIRQAIACTECHRVPATAADHQQPVVVFGALASHGGAPAQWNRGTATCSGVYCHGATLAPGGLATQPVWTASGGVACTSCHGAPPSSHQAGATDCAGCHPQTVKPDGTIDVAGGRHIDGTVQFVDPATVACGSCHAVPPSSGAHAVHVRLASAADAVYGGEWTAETKDPTGALGGYTFGCGLCHPTDAARHGDGAVELDLSPGSSLAGGIKAQNGATASYDPVAKTCSNVYCHSSGQASPAFATSPAWNGAVTLDCGGCHGNPPTYASGAAGGGTANSHIFLDSVGREVGHFAGLPGAFGLGAVTARPNHYSRHGQAAAAPATFLRRAAVITCQTCHAETVDPANTGPSGTFYLDTTIRTQLPGGDDRRLTLAYWKDTQCVTCHTAGGTAPVGTGKVLPLRHVNGRRDVVFDGRGGADLPAGWAAYWANLGLGASAPTRPYFTTDALVGMLGGLPADAVLEGPVVSSRQTLSYQLTSAGYDPATKTCSSVACHLSGTGGTGQPVTWGDNTLATATPNCTRCHE
jgi:predicted CxxxxCH...CXXCH cytochrome family protein